MRGDQLKVPIYIGQPVAGAPYTPAIQSNGLIFVSGQIPILSETGELMEGEFVEEVEQCLQNLQRLLEAAGSSMEQVVKVTVYLRDMALFSQMNAVYRKHFGEVKPARTCIEVSALPLNARIEIEAIAEASS
ncbi:MAG: Rid family detoxifying hydrolase [Armatimonadetes bacterium]|nr:Rid family detoxifying hydrolase [Armatimonadota bacterium]